MADLKRNPSARLSRSTPPTPSTPRNAAPSSLIPRHSLTKERGKSSFNLKPSNDEDVPLVLGADGRAKSRAKEIPSQEVPTTDADQRSLPVETISQSDEAQEVPAEVPNMIVQRNVPHLTRLPSQMVLSTENYKKKVLQDALQREGEVTIRTIKTLKLDGPPSVTLMEITNDRFLVGDNSVRDDNCGRVSGSPSQAVFKFVHDDQFSPDSTHCEGQCLRQVASRCSFINICEGDCRRKASEGMSCCTAFLTVLMVVMLTLLLAITILVNFERLMALWIRQPILEENVRTEDAFYQKLTAWLLKFWEEVKNFVTAELVE